MRNVFIVYASYTLNNIHYYHVRWYEHRPRRIDVYIENFIGSQNHWNEHTLPRRVVLIVSKSKTNKIIPTNNKQDITTMSCRLDAFLCLSAFASVGCDRLFGFIAKYISNRRKEKTTLHFSSNEKVQVDIWENEGLCVYTVYNYNIFVLAW